MPGLSLTPEGAKELAKLHPRLAADTFPLSKAGLTVRLASCGRLLGYSEYVDASLPTEKLRTVVLIPGIPGTRLFTHPAVRERGYVPGWRLFVLERPGIGLSDPPSESYTYTDFVADFREFCRALALPRVTVIGYSAGSPFATAIACVPPPAQPPQQPPQPPQQPQPKQEQGDAIPSSPGDAPPVAGGSGATPATADVGATVSTATAADAAVAALDAAAGAANDPSQAVVVVDGVALVSAIGPPDTPNKRRGMALLFQFAYWACAYMPWLVGWVVQSEAADLRRRPVRALRQSFAAYSGKADVAALKRPEVEEMFLESALEMYSRDQEGAVHRENVMFAGRPWDFDLAACRTPVAIWQGGQDRGCTTAMATHLAARMGSGTKVTVVPEQGHLLYFDLWEEVVAWVNGLAAP